MDIPGNNTTTTTLAIGGVLNDSLEVVGDTDWIKVELIAGESYLFTLTGAGVDPLFDPFLELRDSSGLKVAQDDDAGPGLNPQLRFTAPTSGTYYLVARSYEDENQEPTAGTYTLTADFGPPQNPLDAIDWGTKLASNIVDVFFVPSGQIAGGFQSDGWTPFEINAVQVALDTISAVANLTFNQVFSAAGAEFRLVTTTDPELEFSGRMGPPGTETAGVGVFKTTSGLWNNSLAPGTDGFYLIMHEILHGLGFAHPHDNGGSSEVLQGVIDDNFSFGQFGLNQGVYTNITYNEGFPEGAATNSNWGNQGGPSALDIALLQQKYGANTTYNSTNDVYALIDGNQAGQYFFSIWDTGGQDRIEYNGQQNAVIDLRPATLLHEDGGGGFISRAGGFAGGFTIAAGVVIENAKGGAGNDSITGNDFANSLLGESGNDTVKGGDGNDFAAGHTGNDDLDGEDGSDTLEGGSGDDTLFGDGGNDHLVGGSGNDRLNGGDEDDVVSGGFGFDRLEGADGNDLVQGGGGNDTLRGAGGNDTLVGDGGADVIFGGQGVDAIEGGAGADRIRSEAGNDSVSGGDDGDRIFGSFGFDWLAGDAGDDLLDGDGGNDTLLGGDDNDTLIGNFGFDSLDGGAGDDSLEGSTGNDTVTGGGGSDVFVFALGGGADIYTDFAAGAGTDDAIELSGFGTAFDEYAEVLAAASQQDANVVIDFGTGDVITLLNTNLADLHQDDFLFA
jgi:serralysin